MLLAGDVGGTKTKLAIFSSRENLRSPLHEATFPSIQYPSLGALVNEFLKCVDTPLERACFGVAGPVVAGKAKITNLPWVMDEKQLQQELRIPIMHLINDLDAMGHAVPFLEPADLYSLNTGTPTPAGNLAVIAPGTGLGEAFLTWDGDRYYTNPSEGGHTDFAPTSSEQIGLLRYMLGHFEHVSYEHVCSGVGLPHVYAYLKSIATIDEPAWVAEEFSQASDKTPVIVKAALDEKAPSQVCVEALKMFVAILGAEAGNLALKVLATGGVYIGGGIPPRILHFLESAGFMQAFQKKGRFTELLSHVPVHVILNRDVALLGAAYHGFEI